MKIDVPGCFAVGWLCALPQDWPFAKGRPPAVGRLGRRDIRTSPDDVLWT
jgi:hypothetical protein